MGYQLGIDLGTTYTAAAIHRDGQVRTVPLGDRADAIPSVLLLRDDEVILTGDAASRRGLTEPDRVAREFKRRVGDPTPLLLGSTPYSAEALMAKLLRWTHDRVAEREGGPPESIAITHPANWGPYKQDLLRQAIRLADLDAVTLSEPEAAARYYASNQRVEAGTVVAVYDLGGGTFDAAVLRKGVDEGFELLGEPEGIERLGGIDVDEAVFEHVRRALGGAIEALDPDDPAAVAALARLREECVQAKEALSSDTDASIPVLLPNVQTEVRLTRAELETMVRPVLGDTIAALRRALRSAGIDNDAVDRVLLVGGSSRIPLVAELVSAELGRPVVVDAHPKHAVALGAALVAATSVPATAAPTVVDPVAPAPKPVPSDGRRWGLVAAAAAAVLVVVALAAVLLGGGGGDDDEPERLAATSTTAEEASTTAAVAAPTTTSPPLPFVRITGVRAQGGTYAIDFTLAGFAASFETGQQHVHFFWDTTPRATAGTNGRPAPGQWLVYAGSSPAVDPFFRVSERPAGATQICALVADHEHAIDDVDGDGEPDPDSGNCADLPD